MLHNVSMYTIRGSYGVWVVHQCTDPVVRRHAQVMWFLHCAQLGQSLLFGPSQWRRRSGHLEMPQMGDWMGCHWGMGGYIIILIYIYIHIQYIYIYINDGIQLRDSRTIIVKLRLTKSSKSCTNSVHVPRAQRNRELGCNRSSGVWMLYFRCISLI